MKWPRWSIAAPNSGDFLPIVFGCVLLFISLPGFVLLWVNPDRGSGPIAGPFLVILGTGVLLGLALVVLGIRICSVPGSLAYRLTHGPRFSR